MLTPHTPNRGSYAAWLTAAATAHRSGGLDAKAEAERLYTEMKYAERRAARSRARMKISNRPTGSEWRRA